MTERYHYFRAHLHPFGWGVRDSKSDATVAMGDKETCEMLASIFNGKISVPERKEMSRFGEYWDPYYNSTSSAAVFRYDHDTGALMPFYLNPRAKP